MPAIPEGFAFKEKFAALEAALLSKHPTMPSLLREIHNTLQQYPEQVTLASEEEIRTVVRGLMVQTGVEFAQAAQKGAKAKSQIAQIKSLGTDAF